MPEEIADGLFFIERGWLNANHFVSNGRPKALIDTGYRRDLAETLRLIRQTGVDPDAVELIISTHSHCDHIGGNRAIQAVSGCAVAMHPYERHLIENCDDWSTLWRYYDQEGDFFPVHQSLQDGDVVRLGELELEVLHTPGHASGHICLYCPRHRFLISADALWDGDFGVLTTRVEGSIAPFLQRESLERLAGLDIAAVYPGHGGVIHDAAGAVDRCRKRLDAFLERPERIGRDQAKKVILYVLLMNSGFAAEGLFDYLMKTPWYPEVVDLFFQGQYEPVYRDLLAALTRKGLVTRDGERLVTTLKP